MVLDLPGCHDGVVGTDPVEVPVFQVQCQNTNTATLIHQQVQRKVLNEIVSIVVQRLKNNK